MPCKLACKGLWVADSVRAFSEKVAATERVCLVPRVVELIAPRAGLVQPEYRGWLVDSALSMECSASYAKSHNVFTRTPPFGKTFLLPGCIISIKCCALILAMWNDLQVKHCQVLPAAR